MDENLIKASKSKAKNHLSTLVASEAPKVSRMANNLKNIIESIFITLEPKTIREIGIKLDNKNFR